MGGSAWAMSDFGWRVRAFEGDYRVWVACLLLVLDHFKDGLTAWDSPPCKDVPHNQRTDHKVHHNYTSLSSVPPPHPQSLSNTTPYPSPIHKPLLYHVSHNNT
jgi:hypothetical protein